MLKYQKSKTKAFKYEWKKVAEEMRGTMSKETVEYLKKCSDKIRK